MNDRTRVGGSQLPVLRVIAARIGLNGIDSGTRVDERGVASETQTGFKYRTASSVTSAHSASPSNRPGS
jgi:hypothetical protein